MQIKKDKLGGNCNILKNNIITCSYVFQNKKIQQNYIASPRYLPIIEKDFMHNIVKPIVSDELKNGNLIDKIKAWGTERSPKCGSRYEFKNEGENRIVDEFGFCICEEENWEKIIKELKNKIPLNPV